MIDLLNFLTKNIVSNPEAVAIEEQDSTTFDGHSSKVYIISVDESDTGIVIGKGGQTIKAIRNLVKVKAVNLGTYVDVRLKEKS
ncbi:RNA-binding protein [candidate division WWE3 bacterium CG_4_9_14_0_2_um_filter_35_11]|uniref:RNA-binding protein n=1 Tax=candidate division WWE3 bacterium CG_4_9_14_0_2_um_filter_35_11 TaxID=1975077 RepID=A0A2M8EM90_UNCKA|nr:MAG: RNA-binding protein [candidate division WWE3 bacterium CG10_big_fil_rev_8_21_14_0_10_35_32]PJC23854.1 MAG: RNA-binding protein [candidate division WWE3 bacterium CG_4_9_14_0_2_um_filter_35_11]